MIDIPTGRLPSRIVRPGYGFILSDGTFADYSYVDPGIIQIRIHEVQLSRQ